MLNPNDQERAELLKKARNIAVVGLSSNPERISYQIAEAMQQAGYRIFPVNPMLKTPVLGEDCYHSLLDIKGKVDIVNIFRRSETVAPIVDEAVQIGAKAVWMQLGIEDTEAAKVADEHGLMVIMNRCIKVDYATLVKDHI